MNTRRLLPFFLLTFAISWGVPGAGLLLSVWLPAFPFSLEMYTPFYFAGVWGPAIAAFILIGRDRGWAGIRAYAGRVLDWRLGCGWWLFALVGIPGMYFTGALIEHLRGVPDALAWYDGPWLALLVAFLLRATAGPVEELGWRGFALPLLQRRISPWGAVLVLAAVHTLWHVPAFVVAFASDTHFGAKLPLEAAVARFGINIFVITVFMNVAYNATGGRVTSAFLIHWMLNGIYPWEGGGDVMTGQNVAIAAGAVILVFAGGQRWLRPERAATRVLETGMKPERMS
jgi:uncharacterized protein